MSARPGGGRDLLRLDDVTKTFSNGTTALSGLSLAIRENEFVSLLGPSGCGKSTALRLIAGLGEPSGGRVEMLQARADASGRFDRGIGFVFQEPTLMPWGTVFDNVYLPLRLRGRRRARVEGDIEEAIGLVGLSGFENAYPRELSGGMKMRVSIARALVTRPRLLLMDEPFAALDELTRFRLNDDLLGLWRKLGWTVVLVTHSVYESVYLSSRILVMAARPGRIVAEKPVDRPYPREESFRTSSDYNAYCRAVSKALSLATEGAK